MHLFYTAGRAQVCIYKYTKIYMYDIIFLPQTQKLGNHMKGTRPSKNCSEKLWEKQPHKNLNYENKSA